MHLRSKTLQLLVPFIYLQITLQCPIQSPQKCNVNFRKCEIAKCVCACTIMHTSRELLMSAVNFFGVEWEKIITSVFLELYQTDSQTLSSFTLSLFLFALHILF